MARISAVSSTEVLAGLVDRVTFHNSENGFCVLRIKARGQRDLITVVGHAAMISAGEFIQASGSWINDRTHGVQFRASFPRAAAPTTVEGIEKYLGSGMIRGIGPVYAKKLVRAFGEAVFDVVEQEPSRRREVTGIGPKRAARIIAGWAEQKVIREIMLFLHSNGVGTSRAVRIYKTYGADAVRLISKNPYRLARDIRGIGFRTADQIAAKLGIEKTALIRVRPGISYACSKEDAAPAFKVVADNSTVIELKAHRRLDEFGGYFEQLLGKGNELFDRETAVPVVHCLCKGFTEPSAKSPRNSIRSRPESHPGPSSTRPRRFLGSSRERSCRSMTVRKERFGSHSSLM
jgi:Holliday junction resolvasome RuvABC DNA-binding subunit